MFKKILVPLDGSEFGKRALPVAVALARADGAELSLIRVVEVVAPGDHEPGVISYLDEHRIQVAQDYVTRLAAQLGMPDPPPVDAFIAPDVAPAILVRAEEFGADLIVIASHGESWPVAGALGSVAAKLTRAARCPVLVVGPEADVPHITRSVGRPALVSQ